MTRFVAESAHTYHSCFKSKTSPDSSFPDVERGEFFGSQNGDRGFFGSMSLALFSEFSAS